MELTVVVSPFLSSLYMWLLQEDSARFVTRLLIAYMCDFLKFSN